MGNARAGDVGAVDSRSGAPLGAGSSGGDGGGGRGEGGAPVAGGGRPRTQRTRPRLASLSVCCDEATQKIFKKDV